MHSFALRGTAVGVGVLGLLVGSGVRADVYSYECNSLPVDAGWSVQQNFCDTEEWVQDGAFFQRVEFCPGYDPPVGQQSSYLRSQAEYLGGPNFFMEWVVQTDGVRSEIVHVAPVSFSAWNGGSVNYHAVIASDQVKLTRDVDLPILFFDLEADMAHKFRIELYGGTLYRWFIDGVEVDSGIPELDYLTWDPTVYIRAKAVDVESTAIWDYIRWGDIPLDASGDFDSDGAVDANDFYYFEECFTNSGPDVDAGPGCRWADFDADTDVDCDDWTAFKEAWTDEGSTPYLGICRDGIPTVSTWGLVVMTLLLLVTGTIVLRRNEPA